MRIFLLCFLLSTVWLPTQIIKAQQATSHNEVLNRFTHETGAVSSFSKSTDIPSFIRFPKDRPLVLPGENLSQKTKAFIKNNASLLRLHPDQDDLPIQKTEVDKVGTKHVICQQKYHGIPIYDGLLKFHYDQSDQLRTINGNFIPDLSLDPKAKISLEEAKTIAMNTVKAQNLNHSGTPLKVHHAELYVFQKGMAKGTEGPVNLAYEVEVRNDRDVREFVFVDAHKGKIVEQYTGMAHALSRRLYEGNTSTQIWQEGDAFPGSLDQWQQTELEAAKHAYHFFNNAFGYTSYDGADAEMRTVNNDPGISCPNANWNGVTANYCTGTASDDVVAHEWGHAYTEYTCGLIYAYQSGALNESLSDVWGETIDLINGYEDSGEDLSLRSACSSSDRWRMGEDATSFGGAIRDMWSPTCDGDPGKVTDGVYVCGTGDSGGVHSNSGVPNHAYALLVDGGTYNGQTITGIGFVKAAHIFWRAQSVYLTKTSNFDVMADALESAGTDLLGINLEGLSTTSTPAGPSGEMISAADLAELSKVLIAVELRTNPDACNYQPLLATAPDLCVGSTSGNAIFYEDFEAGFGSWTLAQVPSNPSNWDARDWAIDDTPPGTHTSKVAYAINPTLGNCSTDFENGIIRLQSPVISIPGADTGPFEMAFDHYVSIEDDYDGGNIKYRLNGGSWTLLPGSAFTSNGYNKTLVVSSNDNPMAGQTAFTAADEGSVSGTWGQSQIDLSVIGVVAGSDIEFRWELGTDGCNGWDGWYIDDVRVYTCSLPAISFATAASQVEEKNANINNGCMDYLETTATIQINKAPSADATITFTAAGGSATMGAAADYIFSPAQVTLNAANLSETVTLRIYNDAVVDGEETAVIGYTLNANGGDAIVDLTNQTHTFTIMDDDKSPTGAYVELVNETFESGLGSFTTSTSGTQNFAAGDAVAATSKYCIFQTSNATNFAYLNDDDCNCDLSEARLISPSIDLSTASSASLTFDHAFSDISPESFDVLVSINGGTSWSASIFTGTNSSVSQGSGVYSVPWVNSNVVDLSAYIGNSDVKVAFDYNDGGAWRYGVGIDNVILSAEAIASVQTGVNTGTTDEQYLGPWQTVHFYDDNTGAIMASIENLSAHDYGCTVVEVKRAGTGAAAAWSSLSADYITEKTLEVTPGTNNSSGVYNITTYYTEAEITGWETATGRDRSELVIVKTTNDITNPQAIDPREDATTVAGALGDDLSFTANFTTGFSSFGVGPSAALPVELLSFNGFKNGNTIVLNWETGAEVNLHFFQLERSFDGYTFETIGKVNGKANEREGHAYQQLDDSYQTGKNYYRLKAVDRDKSYRYSSTILIEVAAEERFSFFPNPVYEDLSVQLPKSSKGDFEWRIYNASGQLVKEGILDSKQDESVHQINLENLQEGSYFINVIGSQENYSFRIIKLE